MKISINDEELLTISELEKRILADEILVDIDEEMKSRVRWVVMHKFNNCFDRFKKTWDARLTQRGVEMIPTNKESYAQLVFSQPDYKSRAEREAPREEALIGEMERLQRKAAEDLAQGVSNAAAKMD